MMSVFKCKMCGGTLEINNEETVAICEYCGTKQTIPKLSDEKRANLYDRANHFRRNDEFDKAMNMYEQILSEDGEDAEAYWSIVLCRYGIEYVEDPVSHKRVPTVNRTQFTSIFKDEDYKSAIRYADSYQREVYEAEAKAIDEIQKGILAISENEEPFDIFICYKETDSSGKRTPDSVLATELYHELTEVGFKVFFSRITLENKLGEEYEPYIFAALNSSKVMVVLGTRTEYFNAVWVKNEWSRYLALINGGAKKLLIPAYRDMDPYDLPEEFSHLQAQDMSKLGFMQDIIHGIRKVVTTDIYSDEKINENKTINSGNASIEPLLERAFMFLEDGEWQRADEFCETVLNQDPKNAQAYLGKLMAEMEAYNISELADCGEPFDANSNYRKIMRFGDAELKGTLKNCVEYIYARNENDEAYEKALFAMSIGDKELITDAEEVFESMSEWRDSAEKAAECRRMLQEIEEKEAAKLEESRLKKIKEKKIKKIVGIMLLSVLIFGIIVFAVILLTMYKPIDEADVGDLIKFGTYEQDYNEANGKEDIVWKVVDKNKNKIFVVSKYALDCQQYGKQFNESVSWEESYIRGWLNENFYNEAFTAEEKEKIILRSDIGTDDKVLLLSTGEAEKYFDSDSARKVKATKYAIANGAISYNMKNGEIIVRRNGDCVWWLYSVDSRVKVPYVGESGFISYEGNYADASFYAVRPAIWIEVENE